MEFCIKCFEINKVTLKFLILLDAYYWDWEKFSVNQSRISQEILNNITRSSKLGSERYVKILRFSFLQNQKYNFFQQNSKLTTAFLLWTQRIVLGRWNLFKQFKSMNDSSKKIEIIEANLES